MFRFEFDERVEVNAIVVECKTIQRALAVVSLILGEHYVNDYLKSVHKMN